MIRKISPNENLYLACEPLFPPLAIQIQIDGDGAISDEDLVRALEKAGEANPGSRLRLVGRQWIDSGMTPRLRRADRSVLRERLMETTCEVVRVENSLLFRAFHGVMDARGLLLWVEDVFRALRGEPLIGASSTMTDREAVKTKPKSRAKIATDCPSLYDGPLTWTHLHLKDSVPNLVAKLVRFFAQSAGGPSRFMIPVDLRPWFPDIRTTGNFSNPIFLVASPQDTEAEIQAQILRKLSSGDPFGTSAADDLFNFVPRRLQTKAVRAAQRKMTKVGRFLMTAVLSHLGRFSLASFSTPTFKARAIFSHPLDTPFCPLTLITTEHDNGVEISISSHSTDLVSQLKTFLTNEMKGPLMPIETSLFDQISRSEKTAVVHDSKTLSYSDLDRWSTQVARTLPAHSKFIGVQMPPSIELIVALLAVLKSGAAFVPIDPKLPQERIDFIVRDSGASSVLQKIPPLSSEKFTSDKLESLSDIAYAIYTSGSTGLPKGVVVSHKSFLNYLLWARETYGSNHQSAFFTSIGFDLTLTSIFLPLISEGTIVVYENDPLTGFKKLSSENRVTFLKATPSHLRLIPPLSNLKTLVVGGEQLTTELASKWTCDVFNEYGPTETTIGCVVHKYDRKSDLDAVVPIGRPIANTTLTSPQGELVVEGLCVAEGYLGGRKFEGRYETGDLVHLNFREDLVYEGRVDRQLKVNGIRIEPAEIEAAFVSHQLVDEAAVGLNRHHQLVAYFKSRRPLEVEDLRTYLRDRLSMAVIPSILTQVESFPLSSNGKVDFDQAVVHTETNSSPLSSQTARIRERAAKILNCSPTRLSLTTSLGRFGLDSLSLVILLDQLAKEFYSPSQQHRLFEAAHEFAHAPSIDSISRVISETSDLA